jgi:Ca-activated chloride channel family protein
MLKFEHPDYLWFLATLPALLAWFVFVGLRKKKLLRQIVSDKLLGQLSPELSGGKVLFKQGILLMAIAFLVLAVANPQVGTRIEEVKREGIDLFVALDVSLSMKAEDIKPSRLEKAKRDISALLKKLAGDRVGMIVFAGDAFVQFPLTADYSAADLFISSVDVDAVPTPGTVIASAIETALRSFPKDVPTQKAIIVVSDGENTEGDVLAAVEEAKTQNVRVYTVGMGSPEGGPIPVYEGDTRVDYKRDRNGSIVLSKIDEPMLQQIADATGGSYRRATSGGNEIDDIYKELGSLQKTEFGAKQITGYESRYQWPLAIALLLLLIELLVSERRVRAFDAFKRFVPAVMVLIVATSQLARPQTERGHIGNGNKAFEKGEFTDAEAAYKKALEKNPKSREAQFNLGDAQFKQKRYDEAIREFQNSAVTTKNAADQSASLYNIGNSLFEANKYPESIEAYKKALALNPNDEDARYNLMLARERMKQQQQQKQNQKKDDKQKQDQQKQDQQKQEQDQQQQQQNQQQQQQDQQKKQEQQQTEVQKKNQLPKQEAERILEALRNNEKEIQKRLMKRAGPKVRVEKDW